MRNKTIEFIDKSNIIHNNRYDYSLVEYVNNTTKINIKCKKHGIFLQKPKKHLIGQGCPLCGINKLTNEEFIEKVKLIHGDKYDYSSTNYVDSTTKINITCIKHGIFNQIPHSHLAGNGCPKCAGLNKTTDEFIDGAKKIHGDKYDYSLTEYFNAKTNVDIICPEHGIFKQTPINHISNLQGCHKCSIEHKSDTTLSFINKSKLVHGDRYGYSYVNYVNNWLKVSIECFEHGIFNTKPNNHTNKNSGCPKCGLKYDKSENEVKDFIKSLNINYIENDRCVLDGKELDIYIPSHKLAIEFDGLYWHSNKFKQSNYHLNKTELSEKHGIQLIHIFEDEWRDKQDIVKSRLNNMLGLTPNKIYGRKCEIKEVSAKHSSIFLNINHLQGSVNSKIRLGLYHDNELVSLMTFGGLRKSMGSKAIAGSYELLRFCNKLDTSVIGAADKLLKYFIKTYNPKKIISYADRRWSIGNLYEKLGFKFIHNSKPNYFYIVNNKRENRFKYRKDILVKEGYDINKTEKEIMSDRGFNCISDSGNKKYIIDLL